MGYPWETGRQQNFTICILLCSWVLVPGDLSWLSLIRSQVLGKGHCCMHDLQSDEWTQLGVMFVLLGSHLQLTHHGHWNLDYMVGVPIDIELYVRDGNQCPWEQ